MTAVHQFVPFTEVGMHVLDESCWCDPIPIVACSTWNEKCYGQNVLKHWPKDKGDELPRTNE